MCIRDRDRSLRSRRPSTIRSSLPIFRYQAEYWKFPWVSSGVDWCPTPLIARPKSEPPEALPDQAGINNTSSSMVELFELVRETDNEFWPFTESVFTTHSKQQAAMTIVERTEKLRVWVSSIWSFWNDRMKKRDNKVSCQSVIISKWIGKFEERFFCLERSVICKCKLSQK